MRKPAGTGSPGWRDKRPVTADGRVAGRSSPYSDANLRVIHGAAIGLACLVGEDIIGKFAHMDDIAPTLVCRARAGVEDQDIVVRIRIDVAALARRSIICNHILVGAKTGTAARAKFGIDLARQRTRRFKVAVLNQV